MCSTSLYTIIIAHRILWRIEQQTYVLAVTQALGLFYFWAIFIWLKFRINYDEEAEREWKRNNTKTLKAKIIAQVVSFIICSCFNSTELNWNQQSVGVVNGRWKLKDMSQVYQIASGSFHTKVQICFFIECVPSL